MDNKNTPAASQDQTSKKELFVAIDHGLSFPEIPGLEQPFSLLRTIAQSDCVDGLIASAGIYRQAERQGISLAHLSRMITVDYVCMGQPGGTQELTRRVMVTTPEEAAQYRPDGYKMFFNIYDDNDLLINNALDFSRFAAAGKRLGIQALAEVLFYDNTHFKEEKTQAAELMRGCRIAMELGADLLKIPLIRDHDTIAEIATTLGLPVYILGGSDDHATFLNELKSISHLPISGLMVGRNIWQCQNVDQRIREIADALHTGAPA
jgi:fructose-bisphosphate aldolase, class I